MALTLDDKLVVGISSRALFDLEIENEIFEKKGSRIILNISLPMKMIF